MENIWYVCVNNEKQAWNAYDGQCVNRHGGNERYAWSRDSEHGVGGM